MRKKTVEKIAHRNDSMIYTYISRKEKPAFIPAASIASSPRRGWEAEDGKPGAAL